MLKPLRALVIDDEEGIRNEIELGLLAEGFLVDTVTNGKEGLKRLEASPVDFVITDIFMPEKEGLETIIAIRKQVPQIRIVAISGGGPFPLPYTLDMAEKLGADAILTKPFNIAELLAVVGSLMAAPKTAEDQT